VGNDLAEEDSGSLAVFATEESAKSAGIDVSTEPGIEANQPEGGDQATSQLWASGGIREGACKRRSGARDCGDNMTPIGNKVLSHLRMSAAAVISSTGHRRIHGAEGWLENRAAAEEVLIVGTTLEAANDLARKVAKKKGAALGWHRLTLPQLAFAVVAPILAARSLTPLSRIGVDALVARLVHRMSAEGRLSHYQSTATTPGFPRAVAGVITELRLARIPQESRMTRLAPVRPISSR
jgi:hypothetical protein